MTHKTIHLITVPDAPEQITAELHAVLHRRALQARLQAPLGAKGKTDLEVLLAHASKSEAVELALEFSSIWPTRPVNVHFRVNALWSVHRGHSSAPGGQTDTVHVIHVHQPVRTVLKALQAFPQRWAGLDVHVQASQRATQVVLPDFTTPEHLDRLVGFLSEQFPALTVQRDVSGCWVANGSRHHEFVRFQGGALMPFRTDQLWPD